MSFVVTSSQRQTKHFPLPGYAGSGAILDRPSPVTLPTASMPSGISVGTKTPSVSSYSTRAPGLGQERVRGLPATRRDDEVAADLLAVEDEPSHAALSTPCDELAGTRVAHVENLDDVDPDLGELVGDRERLVVRAENDRALARLHREVANETAHAVGEHDADEVVPGKHERLLRGAGGDDDSLGPNAVEDRAGVDRDEAPLPDSQCSRRREHLDPSERDVALGEVLVDEDDARTHLRRLEGSGPPGLAAADDEHARPAMLRVVAASVTGVRIELPEPGRAAQELLVQRPGARAAG